jgi:hypothetical protein
MAKYRPAGKGKKLDPPAPTRGLLPCALLLVLGFAAVSALLYYSLKSSGN